MITWHGWCSDIDGRAIAISINDAAAGPSQGLPAADRNVAVMAADRHPLSAQCVGSCALNLCSIAAGRADVFFEIGFGGPWDVAAGALILEEAGGAVADPAGGSQTVELD